MGQFIEPMTLIQSYGIHNKKRFTVKMVSKGSGFYSANFNITTKANQKYTVNIRYRVDKQVLDKTTHKKKDYGYFW